jgi:hypothetical protein
LENCETEIWGVRDLAQDKDDIIQGENDTNSAGVKLYAPNALVNLRLTKDREDIRLLLNQKKMQGIDISEYITELIRRAEGLESPSPTVSITEKQMDTLVSRILEELISRGVSITASNVSNVSEKKMDDVNDHVKEELKKAAEDLLDW